MWQAKLPGAGKTTALLAAARGNDGLSVFVTGQKASLFRTTEFTGMPERTAFLGSESVEAFGHWEGRSLLLLDDIELLGHGAVLSAMKAVRHYCRVLATCRFLPHWARGRFTWTLTTPLLEKSRHDGKKSATVAD